MDENPLIARAIREAGSQSELARLSGVSQQHISKLLRGQRTISADVALAIESATKGSITRSELRPDYWQPESNCVLQGYPQ